MDVKLYKAHNGLPSCKINGIPLHSSYNPIREAERAVGTASCKFKPTFVFVLEPGLSYCTDFLKKAFPDSKLCALHFVRNFSQNDFKWDKVFFFDEPASLSDSIFNYMGDDGVVSCFFWEWPPSGKIFESEMRVAWEEIKRAVIKTRNILNTRAFFAKRWIRNAVRFCLFSRYNAYVLKGQSPVIVCASGPSLKRSIPFLKQHRDSYFLVAVSSALAPLTDAGVIPDLCISTDGGYWAKLHLEFALKKHNIPLAIPLEGSCYAEILNNHTVIPISYGDGVSENFLSSCNYLNVRAIRNGTVSGTAADFALSITSAEVYFCGLDLAPSDGYAHTQPNELEINASRFDNRLRTTETRVTPHTFNSPALEIYKKWFSTTNFFGKVFRLSDGYPYPNKLGQVYDVDWTFFRQHLSSETTTKPIVLYQTHEIEIKSRIQQLTEEIRRNKTNIEWIKAAFPQEQILAARSTNEEQRKAAEKNIEESMEKFTDDIIKSLAKESYL